VLDPKAGDFREWVEWAEQEELAENLGCFMYRSRAKSLLPHLGKVSTRRTSSLAYLLVPPGVLAKIRSRSGNHFQAKTDMNAARTWTDWPENQGNDPGNRSSRASGRIQPAGKDGS
jgi:hypothetical protein